MFNDNISIRPLTPDMADDFFDFFDSRAFTDDSPYSPCYCCIWHIPDRGLWEQEWRNAESQGKSFRQFLRGQAETLLKDNTVRGYLAFDGNTAVGWVNSNDKNNYVLKWLAGGNVYPDPDLKIKSVVCFEIAPEYRRRGIASALLGRVCEDAAKDGYDCVEGYAEIFGQPNRFDYAGPVRLYEKCGFSVYEETGKYRIMRKYLK